MVVKASLDKNTRQLLGLLRRLAGKSAHHLGCLLSSEVKLHSLCIAGSVYDHLEFLRKYKPFHQTSYTGSPDQLYWLTRPVMLAHQTSYDGPQNQINWLTKPAIPAHLVVLILPGQSHLQPHHLSLFPMDQHL